MSTTRSETDARQPARRVGDYRLLTRIGEGGMGVVHLAEAADGSRVALKVLRPHIIGDDEARERLAREVASLRRVRSPRIAEIIDADPYGETPFVVTRYVPGLSLHEHARQEGAVRGDDLRHFAAGLAEALLAVHSVGVLHRDVKPSNVLLEGRSPVLIDFGLARLAEDPRLTHTGWLLGTPGYLAPEILYGDDATTSSDVHSWAATVAFAATGRPPFGGGPAMAVMDRVRRGEHDLGAVPPELAPLLLAALAADPAERPSLPAVLADLRPGGAVAGAAGVGAGDRHDRGDHTVPLALATAPDEDATDLLSRRGGGRATGVDPGGQGRGGAHHSAAAPPRTAVLPPVLPPTAAPQPGPRTTPMTTPDTCVPPAARAPYMQPAEPRPGPSAHDRTYGSADAAGSHRSPPSAQTGRPAPGGAARVQRGALLAGLLAGVAVAFAAAPYLAVMAVALGALVLRTWSWTAQATRQRVHQRGSRTWYDAPLAVLSTPWYLLVATAGTLLLVGWAVSLALLTGFGALVLSLPPQAGLLLMGAVLAFTTWWGPGGRRLRRPVRGLVLRATRRSWVGWGAVAVLGFAVLGCVLVLLDSGTTWTPQPGPPWRAGTLLGDVLRFL